MGIWTVNMQPIVNASNSPLDCPDCPCGVPACDDCDPALSTTLTCTVIHQTTNLDITCTLCGEFFATLTNITLAYQGTVSHVGNTYYMWRSDQFAETDCSSIFDEHVISLLIRTVNPGGPGQYCEALAYFHHIDDTSFSSTAYGYNINWGNLYYFGSENTAVCAESSFYMGVGSSADTSLNCLTIPFMEYDLRVDT